MKTGAETQWASLKLVIPTEVHHKLMAYVQLCPVEINGWGMVHRALDGHNSEVITITDVYITKQTVNAAHATADAAGTAKLITDIIQSGGDASNLRVQWHSHVDMPAYFSATDEHTINTAYPQADWLISLVLNKRGEYSARLDVYRPFRVVRLMEVRVDTGTIDPDVVEACLEDISRLVTQERGFFRTGKPVKTMPVQRPVLEVDAGSVIPPGYVVGETIFGD